jgi:hypothetical protein
VTVVGVPATRSFSTSNPWMWSWSAWSLVTVRVSCSPTARSTVVGAGVTVEPLTVMAMVRPDALELDDEDADEEDEDDDEEVDEVLVVDVLLMAGSSPELPHAASARAMGAASAAHVSGARRVIFVTNPSLDSGF